MGNNSKWTGLGFLEVFKLGGRTSIRFLSNNQKTRGRLGFYTVLKARTVVADLVPGVPRHLKQHLKRQNLMQRGVNPRLLLLHPLAHEVWKGGSSRRHGRTLSLWPALWLAVVAAKMLLDCALGPLRISSLLPATKLRPGALHLLPPAPTLAGMSA